MKLLLLDGHSLAYRAFFALPTDLVTSSGTVTNAVYGFTSMLAKVMGDERPDLIGVAFDVAGGSAARLELDPNYKAGRSETPDLFKAQWPLIHEVLDALQIPQIEIKGVEADDVIATLATQAAAAGIDVVIVTGDRDSFQLVNDPHIRVLYNKRGVSDYALYDEAGIVERTGGVTPKQWSDYAALRGDSSDNLPGVPGIGEKTAAKLIGAYNDLEGIYEHLEELPPKQRQNLSEFRERVFINRTMTVLRRDVDCAIHATDLVQGDFDRDAFRVLCNQLEFRTLLPRILAAVGEGPETAAATPTNFDVEVENCRDAGAAIAWLNGLDTHDGWIAMAGRFATGAGRTELLGVAISCEASKAIYLSTTVLQDATVRAALSTLIQATPARIVAHRSKELMHGLGGVAWQGFAHDTAVMAYLVDPGEGKYILEDLAQRYCGIELVSADAAAGQLDFGGDTEVDQVGRSAAATLELVEVLREAVEARELTELYERFELPLINVLVVMEHAGVMIDIEFLRALGRDLGAQAREAEARIHELAGETFAVNSVPQLRTVLFDKLGLTPVKKTKTGPSTDADSLQKLIDEHPIIKEILKYREVEKLRGTYADALPPLVGIDGRIHANFNQLVAATGRISSESPNLQNIPVRSASGREMRKAFVAADGCMLMTADYSQIELRVLAHVAQDPGLIDAFDRGVDVHTVTASKVFSVAEDDVDEFQRRFAKVVNYGLAYGMEAYGLGQRLDIPTGQAQEILDNYFAGFPRVADFMKQTIAQAKAVGYTTTMFGRRRQLPELASDNFRIRQMGERMAQNAPVQGAAADIFKLAMIASQRAIDTHGFGTKMILTVHDELVFEVPESELDSALPVLRDTMEHVCELRVPLTVDVGVGRTWADCK